LFGATAILGGGCSASTTPRATGPAPAAVSPPEPGSPATAGSPGPAVASPELQRISVAYVSPSVTMQSFYIAIQEGFAIEEGLDAELLLMTGALGTQGMLAGQVDFSKSAGAMLIAGLRGLPLRPVFVQVDKPMFFLYSQPEIRTAPELEGKTVGIVSLGDSTELATKTTLKGLGADPAAITFVPNLAGAAAVTALQSGAVAGASMAAGRNDLMAQKLGFRNLGFMGDYLDALSAGLGTHEDNIRNRPGLVLATVRAELKAHRFMQQNRVGTIAHMARFQEVSMEDAAESYDVHMKYLTRDGTSTPEVLERILQEQRSLLGDQARETLGASVDEMFRLDFVRRANTELDRQGWQPWQ
jgi:ABC-type nitrate/sulfonate/bicarbonate transport system substrate-binding protein